MYFLLRAAIEENAFNRMKKVVKWYISGFYKKPKVSRISCVFLGGFDVFWKIVILYIISCRSTGIEEALQSHYRRDISLHVASPKDQQQNLLHWGTGDNNIKHRGIKKEIVRNTSVIWGVFPQVSHHPPVSAFYVSNRKDGFCLSGSILAKSKFYGIDTRVLMSLLQCWRLLQADDKTCPLTADCPPGNSLSAILDGEARLTFLNRGEDYVMNMPYAHCKGQRVLLVHIRATHKQRWLLLLTLFLSPQASYMAPWPWNWVVRLPSPVRKRATVLSWSSDWRYNFVLLLKLRLQLFLCITFVHIWWYKSSLFSDFWPRKSRLRFFSGKMSRQTQTSLFFLFASHSTWAKPTVFSGLYVTPEPKNA